MVLNEPKKNPTRKLFFGLFIFPLLIAVGMAVLLCSVVLLTSEEETPESLITAIKTGSKSKRWQKAFELSNELYRSKGGLRDEGIMKEIIHILRDTDRYDQKTRAYMASALSHFNQPLAIAALRDALQETDRDVRLYALWSLGMLQAKEILPDLFDLLQGPDDALKKMAAYVLGVLGDERAIPYLKPLLKERIPDIRWNAALSLARLGDDSSKGVLMEMLDRETIASQPEISSSGIDHIMINATKGLALLGGPRSKGALEDLSKHDESLKVRQAAIEALRYLKNRNENIDIRRPFVMSPAS